MNELKLYDDETNSHDANTPVAAVGRVTTSFLKELLPMVTEVENCTTIRLASLPGIVLCWSPERKGKTEVVKFYNRGFPSQRRGRLVLPVLSGY
jgi:hypothetical protein